MVDCLVVENDFKYELHEDCKPRTDEEINSLTKDEFIKIIENSGLAGLGGSGFPTYIKFKTDNKIDYVLANGVECEPFVISDYQIMKHKPERVIQGLMYSMKAMDAPNGIIVIKNKYPELKESFENALRELDPMPNIKVVLTKDYYPAGWEIEVLKGY